MQVCESFYFCWGTAILKNYLWWSTCLLLCFCVVPVMNQSSSIIYTLYCRNIEGEILLFLLQSTIQGMFDLETGLREKNAYTEWWSPIFFVHVNPGKINLFFFSFQLQNIKMHLSFEEKATFSSKSGDITRIRRLNPFPQKLQKFPSVAVLSFSFFFFNSLLWHDILCILFLSLQRQRRLVCLYGWEHHSEFIYCSWNDCSGTGISF